MKPRDVCGGGRGGVPLFHRCCIQGVRSVSGVSWRSSWRSFCFLYMRTELFIQDRRTRGTRPRSAPLPAPRERAVCEFSCSPLRWDRSETHNKRCLRCGAANQSEAVCSGPAVRSLAPRSCEKRGPLLEPSGTTCCLSSLCTPERPT